MLYIISLKFIKQSVNFNEAKQKKIILPIISKILSNISKKLERETNQ